MDSVILISQQEIQQGNKCVSAAITRKQTAGQDKPVSSANQWDPYRDWGWEVVGGCEAWRMDRDSLKKKENSLSLSGPSGPLACSTGHPTSLTGPSHLHSQHQVLPIPFGLLNSVFTGCFASEDRLFSPSFSTWPPAHQAIHIHSRAALEPGRQSQEHLSVLVDINCWP